ncbi:hypothetical protein GCM10009630_26000 [Kribbella jejuensis]|uniref:Uncharacterized protein n=1 Tax=Kribbella jejuensis TaxID=236068 RepID=A0A542DUQ0_9ACTN|nr:hypothetical protein [Kribbella jejuensis]TQJ06842.1 hypothetical protein FB475_6518 [Kribbella jejuensis]
MTTAAIGGEAIDGEGPPALARARARRVLGLAFGIVAPEAVALRNGKLRVADRQLPARALRQLERRLARRAGTDVTDDRLLAEAVAFAGAELGRVRDGSPADGATAALDALLDLPALPDTQQAETQALLQDLLDGNPLTTDADLRRLTKARARRPTERPPAADLVATAQTLTRNTEQLTSRTPTLHPPAAGGAGGAVAGGLGVVRRVRRVREYFRAVRAGVRADREALNRAGAARYAEYRELSREWLETRDGLGVRELEEIEVDLKNVTRALARGAHPLPAHPSAGFQVVAPERPALVTPQQRFDARVRRQVAELETAATQHEERAATRTRSAQDASERAADLFEQAEQQAAAADASAGERARRLRTRAVATLRIADRHTAIAAACTRAATQARNAATAYETLLTDTSVDAARAAAQHVRAYDRATAATLPSIEVQHNGLPSGRLPHLTTLCQELNQALEDSGSSYRFTPDVLHRTLRAESRRILSPEGFVLTVGNDPRANVDELVQLHLKLDPGELQEVLDSPIGIDEAQVGQVVQAGFGVTTAATHDSGRTIGASLQSLTAALPPTSKLKAIAQLVSPGVEFDSGRTYAVSGGATEFAQTGAVEALRGEFLRYRATRPQWNWRIRTSATGDWSPPRTVRTGADHDSPTLDLGFIHTYTVPPPTEQVDLSTLGLDAERNTAMPEHMATRVDGLNDLCDRTVAELTRRLGTLDRVGHDRVRSLVAEDAVTRLDETTRPGGLWRLITSGGRPVAWAQLETIADLDSAELVSDSSPDHKLEFWRVGNSGASGGQSFGTSRTVGVSATYGGSALADVGATGVGVAPGLRAGRSTGRDDAASTADLGSRWSTQRVAPTVGVKLRLRHKVTVHRLDREESFTTTSEGDAHLRMAERDAFRYGLPVPAAGILRDAEGKPRYGTDGRLLLRGDAEPTESTLQLPGWLGNGPGKLRGAGPAMIRNLTGADEVREGFLEHLAQQSMIPPLGPDGVPRPAGLTGLDPAVQLSRSENWEHAIQQLGRRRLETGYDHAAQDGLTFRLTEHRTGHQPRVRSYRISIEQHFDRARPIGLAGDDMVVNVDIGVSTSGRSGGRSRSLPWSARLGLTRPPADGQAGIAPQAGAFFGRTSLGRYAGWLSSRSAYRMTVSESSAQVAVFDVPHTITISEITDDGTEVPVVSSEGAAQIWMDSEFCNSSAASSLSVSGQVDPTLLHTATIQHVDARDPMRRLIAAVPELGHGDSSALHHLSAFLAPRNLISRPELLTTEYSTGLAIGRGPSDPLDAMRHLTLAPRRTTLDVRTRVENLKYVGTGRPILAELNLTLAGVSSTSTVSTGKSAGASAGAGSVSADGSSIGGTAGGTRSTSMSASGSQSASSAVERTLMRDGQHYQFLGDLVLAAQLRSEGADPQAIPLETGAVVLTLPEHEALRMYGRRQLDLPLHQVSDAVERLLNGNLDLSRRTAVSLLRRYRDEKTGSADGLAAGHDDERLADLLRDLTGVRRTEDDQLDAVLASAEELARQRVDVRLPRHYQHLMGAAQVDRSSLQDQAGNDTDMFGEVCAAVGAYDPQALADPVLISALRGDLSGTRWRNQLDDMLDPRGFVRELPVGDRTGSRDLRVRIRVRFVGPATAEAGGTTGHSGNGFGLVQLWSMRERSRSVTRGTTYGGTLGLAGQSQAADGASATAGVGAEVGASTTASSSELNTRISTGLSLSTARVERDYEVTVEVEDRAGRTTTRRVSNGRMSLSVPASVIDSEPSIDGGHRTDHRPVRLPDNYLVEGTTAHADGADPENTLFDAACKRLGRVDMLGADGVRTHEAALDALLGGGNRMVAFQEMAAPAGYELPRLPVPDDPSRGVVVRVRAEPSGLELISNPEAHATTQLGENSRELRVSQLTAKSNHLLPGSGSAGGSTPGGDVTAGVTQGRQVAEQDTGTVGVRHETGAYESGEVVTVKVTVAYHLDFERHRLDRHQRPRVDRTASVPNAASGEAFLTMFRHEYEAMQARMEAGQPALTGWDLDRQPRPARVRTVRLDVTADPEHPYRPLVEALDQAHRNRTNVRLRLRQADGTRRVYVAGPDGTLTCRGDNLFAKAFATLHPRLALLAEGRVNLRDLLTEQDESGRFTATVVDALQQRGIPASALTGTDSRMRQVSADGAPMYRPTASGAGQGLAVE